MATRGCKRGFGSVEDSMKLLFGDFEIHGLCKDDFEGSVEEHRIFQEIFDGNSACNTTKERTCNKTTACRTYANDDSHLHVNSGAKKPISNPTHNSRKSDRLKVLRSASATHKEKPISKPTHNGRKSDRLKVLRSASSTHKESADQDIGQTPYQIVESSSQGIMASNLENFSLRKTNSFCYINDNVPTETNQKKNFVEYSMEHSRGKCNMTPISEERHVTMVLALPCVSKDMGCVHETQEELQHVNHSELTPLSAAIADARKRCTQVDLPHCLRTHAHNLLLDIGFQTQVQKRKGRCKVDLHYWHDGGPIIRSLSRAWKECGKLFASSADCTPENSTREWIDVDAFWNDLSDVLEYIEEKVSSPVSSLPAVKRWQLLNPFVSVVCIDRRISTLRKGRGIKVINGATIVFKTSSDEMARQRNESPQSIASHYLAGQVNYSPPALESNNSSDETVSPSNDLHSVVGTLYVNTCTHLQIGCSSHCTVSVSEGSNGLTLVENSANQRNNDEMSQISHVLNSHCSMSGYGTKSAEKKPIFCREVCQKSLRSLARSIGNGFFVMRLHEKNQKSSVGCLKLETISYGKISYSLSEGFFAKATLHMGSSRVHFRRILWTQKPNSSSFSNRFSNHTNQANSMIGDNRGKPIIEDGSFEEIAAYGQQKGHFFPRKRKYHEVGEMCDSIIPVNKKKFHRNDETNSKEFSHKKSFEREDYDKNSNFLHSDPACLQLEDPRSSVKRKAAGISCQTEYSGESINGCSAINGSLKQHNTAGLSVFGSNGTTHRETKKDFEIKASKMGAKKRKTELTGKTTKKISCDDEKIIYVNKPKRGLPSEHSRHLESNKDYNNILSRTSGDVDGMILVPEVCPRAITKCSSKANKHTAKSDRKDKRHIISSFKERKAVGNLKSPDEPEEDETNIRTEESEFSTELLVPTVANSSNLMDRPKALKTHKSKPQKEDVQKQPRVRINDSDLLIAFVIKSKNFSTGKLSADRKQCLVSNGLGKLESKNNSFRLLLRTPGKSGRLSMDGKRSSTGARTVLAWLIDSGVLPPNDVIQYRNLKKNIVVKDGWITRDGIVCNCCTKIHSVSEFRVHAGSQISKPSLNLFLVSGKPYSLCQLQAWSAEYKSRKCDKQVVEVEEMDQNDDICGVCGDGGELLCCDNCPSTFHQDCLPAQDLPEGSWYCQNCTCRICGDTVYVEKSSKSATMLKCTQCQNKYHKACIRGQDEAREELETDSWFCSTSCHKVYLGFRSSVGILNSIADGYYWTTLRCSHGDLKVQSAEKITLMVECNIKLAVALSIMEECFLPMVDPRTGIHIIPHILFNWGSNYPRLNHEGFYTIILEKNDEVISVATIRAHGVRLAEMPLIATCSRHRRQGMCRLLMTAIEKLLKSLNVEMLVLSAIPSLVDTWMLGFGFESMGEEEKQQLNNLNLMLFPETLLLKKRL